MQGHVNIGSYTGTGAAQDIELGFAPEVVQIFNATDFNLIGVWFTGMSDGTAIDIAAAVAPNTADGISAYAGVSGATGEGFTVGTDFSVSGKTYRFVALANQ